MGKKLITCLVYFFIIAFSTELTLFAAENKTRSSKTKQQRKVAGSKKILKKGKKNKAKKKYSKIGISPDDRKISAIIDNQQKFEIKQKKIPVKTKNKGVPEICLNNSSQQQKSVKTNNDSNKQNKSLIEAKDNLKSHIKRSLVANDVSGSLVDYIHNHLEYHEPTKKKHAEVVRRKMIDFIEKYKVQERVKMGKMYKKQYRDVLMEIENLFNVDAEAVLAIWGMETNYGEFIGKSDAFNALYSACMNAGSISRLRYFENNIIALAILVDRGYFEKDVISSFDGGLGGCQFMPDSFYRYAVSLSGDRKTDIINSNEDVLASIANYLHSFGWRYGQGILTEIKLPEIFDPCLIGMNTVKTVGEWKKLGIKPDKNKVGKRHMNDDLAMASIILTDPNDTYEETPNKRAFLVYDNYKVIMGYNRQLAYGLTTGLIFEGIIEN